MSYSLIGRGLLDEIPKSLDGVSKVLIVHPQPLAATAELLSETLRTEGFEAFLAEVPQSEEAKRVEVAAFCWGIMGQADFHRNDAVIGLGGGTTTDLAGFVGGTWLRGVRTYLIPTTLLGMVDAAIGGKTGVNTQEGKNLVGVFHLPTKVFIDLDTLETLPRNDLIAGMSELVKYGFISDTEILDIVLSDDAATDTTSEVFEDLVRRSVSIKERVTTEDFRESGQREFLNYGHTLGHAIEHAERYKWRHGAAISIGMTFAAELSMLSGKLSESDVEKHRSVFSKLGLPTNYKADKWPQLLEVMQRDKKARSGALRFVVLEKIGKPGILAAPTPELLFTAFQAIVE
ncbi:MAG: 3-dehydroquinate synthase [Candidatus Aquiluna sp. XM-24bin5]|nr:MAG: 3-dehydroquinate synthase [Candidatus Aquiluna sp. XM-24bin5]